MHFVLETPPLQHIAGVKIVAHLWNQRDLQNNHFWQSEKVKSKISTLPLPGQRKKQLIELTIPLGLEDLAWCEYHNFDGSLFQSLNLLLPHQLCWTMHGTVDYKKTAELMMKDESLDVERRYKFACLNCLEDEAAALFESMGAERRREFVSQMHRNMINQDHKHLLAFFTFTLTGEAHCIKTFFYSDLRSDSAIKRVLFEGALANGDAAMCQYWFKKLSQGEKERVVEESPRILNAVRWSGASTLLYYLSLLNEEQLGRIFRECLGRLLLWFLRWPMQPLFVEAAQRGWQLMGEEDCARVLDIIIERIQYDFRDYDYSQLFWECWRLTPADFKPHFLNNIFRLERLVATKEGELIRLVLKQSPLDQLRELMQKKYDKIRQVLMDESVISEAALLECKQTAVLNSSNDKQDVEKRLRSECLSQLVDIVIAKRRTNREIALMGTATIKEKHRKKIQRTVPKNEVM